jgi:hypothetical protein
MFNAIRYTKKLEEVGISREQAEAHIHIFSEIVEGELATKQDLSYAVEKIDNKMLQMEYRLIIKIGTIVTIAILSIIFFQFSFF